MVETFIAKKNVIISKMKYFSKSLAEQKEKSDSNDIVDIQVCCDAKIFKFVLDYCTELH